MHVRKVFLFFLTILRNELSICISVTVIFSRLQKQTKKQAVWRCSVRRKAFMCTASVTQEGDIFQAKGTHTHAADPSMRKKVELKRNVS